MAPPAKRARKAQASSISTVLRVPGSSCSSRSLTNVSVVAATLVIGPASHIAVSMECASRSPVTPLPDTLLSSRHRVLPPCGTSGLMVQSCR